MQIVMGWILSNVALLGSLNGAYSFYQPDADKTVLESAFYNGLFRNVWAFGVGVTIFMCEIGYGGKVPNHLSLWSVLFLVQYLYCLFGDVCRRYQLKSKHTCRFPATGQSRTVNFNSHAEELKTRSLTLREEHRPTLTELGEYLDLRRRK